ncbi:hypothetical protein BDA96_10G341300, partial [Sorghum bicolor]
AAAGRRERERERGAGAESGPSQGGDREFTQFPGGWTQKKPAGGRKKARSLASSARPPARATRQGGQAGRQPCVRAWGNGAGDVSEEVANKCTRRAGAWLTGGATGRRFGVCRAGGGGGGGSVWTAGREVPLPRLRPGVLLQKHGGGGRVGGG